LQKGNNVLHGKEFRLQVTDVNLYLKD